MCFGLSIKAVELFVEILRHWSHFGAVISVNKSFSTRRPTLLNLNLVTENCYNLKYGHIR